MSAQNSGDVADKVNDNREPAVVTDDEPREDQPFTVLARFRLGQSGGADRFAAGDAKRGPMMRGRVSMRLVWDASALIAMINTRDAHHPRAYEVWEEHREAISIFPALAWFEYLAFANRRQREGSGAFRQMYILDEKNIVLSIDQSFIRRCSDQQLDLKFGSLTGADLVYACAAFLENARLVTFDNALRSCGLECLP